MRKSWHYKVYFLKLHMCLNLRTKFQVSNTIITSFRQGVFPLPPIQKETQKIPPRIGLIINKSSIQYLHQVKHQKTCPRRKNFALKKIKYSKENNSNGVTLQLYHHRYFFHNFSQNSYSIKHLWSTAQQATTAIF